MLVSYKMLNEHLKPSTIQLCFWANVSFTLAALQTDTGIHAHIVDPDKTAHHEPSYLDLPCVHVSSRSTLFAIV